MQQAHVRVILGIDPGLKKTGWGVIHLAGNTLTHQGHGVIYTKETDDIAKRLETLYLELSQVIDRFSPEEASIEKTFLNKNPDSTLKLGMVRGALMLAPALKGIPVSEYAANQIKKAIVGVGHADKNQVALMVRTLLPKAGTMEEDAADALSIAICHGYRAPSLNRL